MSSDSIIIMLGLGLFGVACITLGVCFTKGYFRTPLLNPTLYTNAGYAAIPIGLGFITMGFGALFPYPNPRLDLITWLMIIFIAISLILNFTAPRFLAPDWYLMIKDEPEHIQEWLFEDARNNYDSWKVSTQSKKEIEEWIAEVKREKRGSNGRHP